MPQGLYRERLVDQHYPAFREMRAEGGRLLPGYVKDEFEAYLNCGRLEEGFTRLRCEQCHAEKLGRVPLQEARLLSLLRCKAYGRNRRTAAR